MCGTATGANPAHVSGTGNSANSAAVSSRRILRSARSARVMLGLALGSVEKHSSMSSAYRAVFPAKANDGIPFSGSSGERCSFADTRVSAERKASRGRRSPAATFFATARIVW